MTPTYILRGSVKPHAVPNFDGMLCAYARETARPEIEGQSMLKEFKASRSAMLSGFCHKLVDDGLQNLVLGRVILANLGVILAHLGSS